MPNPSSMVTYPNSFSNCPICLKELRKGNITNSCDTLGHYFAIYFDNTDYGDDSISSLRLEVDMYKTIYQADLENNTSILTVCNKEIEVPYLLPLDFPDLIQFNYEIKKMIAFL